MRCSAGTPSGGWTAGWKPPGGEHERASGAAPHEQEEVAVQLQADDVRAAQAGDDAQLRNAEIEGRHEAGLQVDERQVARRQVEDESAEEDELRRVGQLDDDGRLAAHETAGPVELEHGTEQDTTWRGGEEARECRRDAWRVTLRIVGEQQRAERPVEDRTGEPVEVGTTGETEDATDARDGEAEADLDPGLREPGAHHDEERQRLPVRRRPQHTERGDGERRDLQGERAAPITLRRVQEDAAAGHDRQVDRHADAAERRRRDGRRRAARQAEADLDTELGGAQRHRCGRHLDGDVGPYAEPQLWSSTFGAHSDAHAERLHVERADPAGAWQGHVERGVAVQDEAELRVRGDLHVDGGQFGPRDDRGEQLGQQGGSQARQTEGEISMMPSCAGWSPVYATPKRRMPRRGRCSKSLALDPQYAEADCGWVRPISWSGASLECRPPDSGATLARAQKAIALDDSLPGAYSLLSFVYTQRQQYDQAVAEGERAIALDPNNADSYAWQAEALNFAGRPEEALRAVEQAMRLNPRYPPFYLFALGWAYT